MGFELDGLDDDAPAQEESKFRKSDNNIALTKKRSQEQRQLQEAMHNEETKNELRRSSLQTKLKRMIITSETPKRQYVHAVGAVNAR